MIYVLYPGLHEGRIQFGDHGGEVDIGYGQYHLTIDDRTSKIEQEGVVHTPLHSFTANNNLLIHLYHLDSPELDLLIIWTGQMSMKALYKWSQNSYFENQDLNWTRLWIKCLLGTQDDLIV